MKGLFDIRLRRALHLKTRDQRIRELVFGREFPATVIPARTTLAVTDVFEDGMLCVDPQGRKLHVDTDTLRESAYIPR